MRPIHYMAALACGLLLSGTASAVVGVNCEGPGPHDADVAAALADAEPGGSVQISGTCELTAQIILAKPVTLQGVGSCATINQPLGNCISIAGDASGSTIKNLVLNCGLRGVSTWTAGAIIHAPDDITIINNEIHAGLAGLASGRGIQLYNCTGPPFNDINECTGAPAGISTGWVIANNVIEVLPNPSAIGILMANGSDIVVRNNDVTAPIQAYSSQNNRNSPACTAFGGAPPGNRNNLVSNNRFTTPTVDAALWDFGYDFFALVPEDSGCGPEGSDRGGPNLYRHNCTWNSTGGGNGVRLQLTNDLTFTGNSYTVVDDGGDIPGTVAFSFDSHNLLFSKSSSTGYGDSTFLLLFPTDIDNTISQNKIGLGYHGTGDLFVDLSTGPNTFSDNKYCTGTWIVPPTDIVEGNQDDHFCGEPPTSPGRPASACLSSLVRRGCSKDLAPSSAMAPAPDRALRSAGSGRDRDKQLMKEPLPLVEVGTDSASDLVATEAALFELEMRK